MAEVKRVTLHPIYDDGSINRNINIYPKTLIDGIVDRDEKPVDILGLIDEEKQRAIGREDEIEDNSGNHLEIDQDEQTGIVTIKLLNIHDEVLDTKTLDLETEKIIKTVDLDYEHKKLIFTLVDGTTIECDISQMIDDFNQKITDEHDRAVAEETALNERIDDLDLEQVGSDGSYLKYVSQQDGQLSASSQAFDTVVPVNNPSNINAPTTEAVRNAIKDLDYSLVGENGNYIKYVSETDGVISATLQPFDITLTGATDNNAPTSKTVKDYADAIEADIHSKVVHKGTEQSPSDETIWGTKTFKSEQSFENDIDLNNSDIKNVNWLGAGYATIDELSVKDGSKFKLGIGQDNLPYLYTTGNLTDGTNNISVAEIGSKAEIQTEAETRAQADTALNTRIDNLDLTTVGESGYYIKTVGQTDGQLSATKEQFDTIINENSSHNNVPSSLATKNYVDAEKARAEAAEKSIVDTIDALDLTQEGSDGNYIKYVSQTDGQVSATKQTFDTVVNSQSTNNNAPTSLAVENRIKDLDVASVGSNGSYLKTISENDGLISATPQAFDTSITSNADDNNAPTTKATKDYVDAEKSRAQAAESALGTRIDDLDKASVGGAGTYIRSIYEEAGIIYPTAQTFDTDFNSPSNNNAPTTKAVDDRFDADESNLSTHISNKSNPHQVTKSQVELGDVVNTGDSDTPTQNGITKFTTGGAYTLKTTLEAADTALQNNINTVDDKLNVNVHVEGSSDEITYNGDTVTKTSPYKNLKTGSTGSRSEVIHLANATTAGMMSHTDYNTIIDLVDRVSSLEGTSVRITYSDSSTPTAAQIKDAATAYLATRGVTDPTDSDYNGVSVRVVANNHLWNYYANIQTYRDDGLDTVNQFNNEIAGIIKGKQADGFVYAENDGTGSVYGWSDLKTRMSNAENTLDSSLVNVAYDSTNKKLTKTTNAGTQTDIVNLGIVTTTGSESVTVNSDTLNVVTRDTAQTITANKQFKGQIRVGENTSEYILGGYDNNDHAIRIFVAGTAALQLFNSQIVSNKNINPYSNGTQDFGDSTHLWKDLYFTGLRDGKNNSYKLVLPDSTSWTEDKTIATVEDNINVLDLNEVGAAGSYIKLISQSNGQVSAAAQTFDTTIPQTGASTTNAPTSSAVVSYVDTYGGKIDTISINGTNLTIDANKNVDIPAYLTTTTGFESVNINNASLNVVTRDTAQDISGIKTFTVSPVLNNDISLKGKDSSGTSRQLIRINTYDNVVINDENSGGTFIGGTSLSPNANEVKDLGSSSYKWKDLYLSGKAYIGANAYITCPTTAFNLYVQNNRICDIYNSSTYWGTTFSPLSGGDKDLGTSSNLWRDLYLSRNLTDGTNSITVAHIEDNQNKVTSISDSSTDTEYPSAKCVYDSFDNFRTEINAKVLSYSATMEILTSAIMPEGTTIQNNSATFPEGVTINNHNINL